MLSSNLKRLENESIFILRETAAEFRNPVLLYSIGMRRVLFRTLGCYPLTGAVESSAETVWDVYDELRASRFSERQGRRIDSDQEGSMEKKKQEGYF